MSITIATVIAVAVSMSALLAAIGQLTLRQRMRRVADWARQSGDPEPSVRRKAALREVEVWATGHVLASTLVPSHMYLGGMLWVFLGPAMIAVPAASGAGTQELLTTTAFAFVALAITFRRTVRVHLERLRIAHEYFKEEEITPPSLTILHQMESGTRIEFVYGALMSGGICLLSLGVARLTLLHDFAAELSDLILVVIGVGLLLMPIRWIQLKAPSVIHAGWTGANPQKMPD